MEDGEVVVEMRREIISTWLELFLLELLLKESNLALLLSSICGTSDATAAVLDFFASS